jgi:hypothetical protein
MERGKYGSVGCLAQGHLGSVYDMYELWQDSSSLPSGHEFAPSY